MKKITFLLITGLVSLAASAQCWESVSSGYSHMVAIGHDGSLWTWGMNHQGELGDGTNSNEQPLPVKIGTDTDWKMVAAGSGPSSTFNLAIKDNGTLWAWGNNAYGQVGDGTFTERWSPVQVGTDTDWKTISAGYSHALAIKNNGTLWSWGDSSFYALGYGDGYGSTYHKNQPTQVGTASTWKAVAAGDRFSIALATNGSVWGWGYNTGDQISNSNSYVTAPTLRSYNNTNVKSISAGKTFSYDVKTSNLLVSWGNTVYGESGGTTCAGCPSYYIKDFDCGANTAAIIKTNNTLWYTGKKLGYTETTVQYTAEFLQLGNSSDWATVSVGNQSGAALKTDGSLWTWGWNFHGQLGIGTSGSDAHSLTLVAVACPAELVAAAQKEHVAENFSIYPNPVEDILNIKAANGLTPEKVVVFNALGMEVINTAASGSVNTAALPAGIYIARIFSGGSTVNCKFIKK